MIGFLKSIFQRQKWALVKSFEAEITVESGFFEEEHGTYYIHCFESDKGNRKITCMTDIHNVDMNHALRGLSVYQHKIYRWVNGRNDPDIPRYDQVNEEDTVNYLRGNV